MELTTHLITIGGEKRWVLAAFDEAGNPRYSDATPAGDLYAPVPDVYKTYESAKAALDVVNAWTDDQSLEELRETEEWGALKALLADTSIAHATADDFADDDEAFEHYEAIVDGGSVQREAEEVADTTLAAEDEDEEESEEEVEDDLAAGEEEAEKP